MANLGLDYCPKCGERKLKTIIVKRKGGSVNYPVKQAVCQKCKYRSAKW